MEADTEILKRKSDHIDHVLSQAQAQKSSPFDSIQLIPNALPECDLATFPLATNFLGRRLTMPFLISSMTGGPLRARKINQHLAEAAEELGIAFGIGSQRVALLNKGSCGLSSQLRKRAPSIPIYANIGAAQLREDFTFMDVQRAIDMVAADALIIHLNAMQEAVQDNGDLNWSGILSAIEKVCDLAEIPIIVKEVGFGISVSVARRLINVGVSAIDVAGSGGTNFISIEGSRSISHANRAIAETFQTWGLSTPEALMQIRNEFKDFPLIASGGIRHGLDAAKSIKLGANLVAQAGPVLRAACESTAAVVEHFKIMETCLRYALACSEGYSVQIQ